MCDEWMPRLKLPLTPEQFHQLPRSSAYRYDYLSGQAHLTPRPRHYHAQLALPLPVANPRAGLAETIAIRPMGQADFPELEIVFVAAFQHVPPFAGLDDATRRDAAHQCLEKARSGGEGPWIDRASFVAVTADRKQVIGAILVTLLPDGAPDDGDSYYWNEPAPQDWLERGMGRPHLTWIFVAPLYSGQGIGGALLSETARVLHGLGDRSLLSTFLLGNESSMLWHWRNGFQLLPSPCFTRPRRRGL